MKSRQIHLLVLFCILLPRFLFSQDAPKVSPLYFPLSYDTDLKIAKASYKKATALLEEIYLLKADSFSYQLPVKQNCIKAQIKEDEVSLSYYNNSEYEVEIINHPNDFALTFRDDLGQIIPDAKVKIGNKKIPFDSISNTYRLYNYHFKGETKRLILVTKNNVWVGEAENYNYSDWNRKFKLRPYRIARSIYWKGRRLISRMFKKSWNYPGYIASNKPKYRPGDTLKIKGFLMNRKGQPLTQPLLLKLTKAGKNIYADTIVSTAPGNYSTEIELSKTLDMELDNFYNISFYDLHRTERMLKSHSFRFEDYQLDEVLFTIHKIAFHVYEEPLILEGSAKFRNGMAVPDGEVTLVLKSKGRNGWRNISKFWDQQVIIPDTLFQYESKLNVDGTFEVLVPDSVLPKAELEVYLEAFFRNSNGELQQKSNSFTIKKPSRGNPNPFRIELDKSDLVVHCRKDSLCGDSILLKSNNRLYPIALPHREPINTNTWYYEAFVEGAKTKTRFEIDEEASLVDVKAQHQGKQLNIQIDNPRLLRLNYEIYSDLKLIEKGSTAKDAFILNRLADPAQNYNLLIQYQWSAEPMNKTLQLRHYEQELKIEIEQAPKIAPGATTSLKIKVKDSENKPVSGLDLTAGAINAQFESFQNFSKVTIPYKRGINWDYLNWEDRYDYWEDPEIEKRLSLETKYYSRFNLDTLVYYQVRHPNNGFWQRVILPEKQDSFYNETTQFAPYITKNGALEGIVLIYCNRKLVYYHDVDEHPPYSFFGKPGYNRIDIRTRDRQYRIDSLWLEKGQKLEFSLDAQRYQQAPFPVQVKTMPTVLTKAEQNLIANRFFVLRQTRDGLAQLSQGDRKIHLFQMKNHVKVYHKKTIIPQLKFGPFDPSMELKF